MANGLNTKKPLSEPARALWAWAIGAVGAGVLGLLAVHLPGVPYNVTELVEQMAGIGIIGPVLRLSLLAAAGIGVGVLPAWIGRWTFAQDDRVRWFSLWLVGGAMLLALLVVIAAPRESVSDLVGDPTWVLGWFFEAFVRVAALILIPVTALALASAWWDRLIGWGFRMAVRNLMHLALPAILCFALSRLIVIHWSATDNIVELMDHGAMAEFQLLALALLLAFNAGVVGRAAAAHGLDRAASLLAVIFPTLIAALVAYFLFRMGTADEIQKYDWTFTFSATQFLLGADRRADLSLAQILLRWYVVYCGATLVLGLGVGIGLRLGPLPRIREDAQDMMRAEATLVPDLMPPSAPPRNDAAVSDALPPIEALPAELLGPPIDGAAPASMGDGALPPPIRPAAPPRPAPTPRVEKPPVRRPPRLDLLVFIALIFSGLTVYGSMVPLTFNDAGWTQGWRDFADAMRQPASPALNQLDWTTNALIFGFLGFVWMTALLDARQGRIAAALLAPAVWIALLGLGAFTEFAQTFVPARTVSRFDLAAQALGLTGGIGLWIAARPRLAEPFRHALRDRAASLGRSLLLLNVVGYLMYAVMPLDFITSSTEWHAKRASHQVNLIPFTYPWPSAGIAAWELVSDLLLAVPIGVWLAQFRRPLLMALALFVGVELAQCVLRSRVCDSTDVIVAVAGAAIGLQLAGREGRLWLNFPPGWYLAAAVYALALLVLHLAPFRFDAAGFTAEALQRELFVPPFTRLYQSSPFTALDQLLRRFLLGLPLGVLLALALPRGRFAMICGLIVVVVWFLLIELLQAASPAHTGDFTDAVLALMGVIAGLAIAKRWITSA